MINNSFWTIIFTVQLKGISLMDVAHGPSFIYEPPARVLISSGSGGTVPCSAHGIPPPSLSWLDSMEQPVSVIKGLREVLQNGTLWFPQFNARDYNAQIHEQEYRCVATNPAGVIVSRHSSISTVMSGFQFSLTVYSVSVEVGNIALMKCGGGREYIDVIGWMRDSDELHTSGRILITTAGDLHIKDVQFTDSIYHYSCKYRNKISGEETLSKPGSIKVTESRGSSLNRPDTVNSAFRVKVGGSIDLPCVGQGYPPPVYSWYKMNQLTGNQEPLNASPSLFPRDSVLSIVGARRTDSGRYICKIHNSVSQFLVEHQLEVYSPLSSYVNPSYIVSDYGRTAIINCTVDGAPVLNVFWLKDGQIVMPSQRIRLTPTTLTIRNVMSSDGGMYQCLAVNEEEESQATAQLVLGSQPPVFNYVFPKEVHQEGPKISLRCEVSGNPPPSISWFLDQHRISFGSGRSLILHQNTGFVERVLIGQYLSAEGTVISHLNISTVLSTDGGLYRCVAKNSVGSVEHSARLNIYGPPTSRGRLNQTAVAGSDVLLVCPVSGYPIHKVEWSTQHQIIKGPRPAPLTNGSLLIRNVEKNDNIEYSCTAYSDGQGSATAYVVLIVIEAPKISPFAFDGDLKEGDRSQVSCTISSGDLPISIRWEKNGNQLEASKNVQIQSNPFSSSIFFFSLTAAHSGSYTCLAENSADVSNFTAQLIVKVSPHWLVEPANQTVVYHESVVINCQAGGNPRPTISWRRSTGNLNSVYEYVQTSDGNIQFHPNGSLVLKAVRQSGKLFSWTAGGLLNFLISVPVYFEHFKANRTAIVNQDAALVCNPFGDHPIRVVWRRGEQELNGKQDRFSFASANSSEGVMNTLTIRNVQRQDGREYTCFASNRFGSQYLTVQLAVYEPPEPPSSLYVSDLTSRSMVLSWYPAFDGNSPVLHYLVQFKPQAVPWREAGNITVSREHSYTRLDGLLPNNIYLLRVISVNSIGLGPPSLEIVAQTKEEVPSGSPVSVRVEAVSSTQILVSWQPPREDDRNGILLGYSVRYGELNSEHLTKKTVRSVSTTELRLSGLVPFTKYQVMVNAFNSIGAGPTSSRSIISTHEAVPGSPPEEVRCEPVSPSLLSISWKPPVQNMNGIVLGYSVTYRRENLVGGKDAIKEVKVGGLYTSITDLETYTSYYIKVAAFTKVGKGVSSEKLICTTGQDVPSAPEDVKAVVVSADSIKLSWRPPAWRNGDILSYSIFTQVDRQTSTTTVAATETEFLIKDLRERQHYEFWVVARTAIGTNQIYHSIRENCF
ncbi:Down syndrome cell adhesion molecule-like protein Dscam2 [Eurytemora carolleeae]|uniref:Down syndrome cell adhesion molecule-like protein Dscam2 n=1 Tax=Eurytemora carolleeae TaxID=1294199 RepID=UPI000C790BAE|nr:Down syndrome cell adhesion molecule-like protein Dscam2 [Eurytemora carolleeae]|eukprot:XP_023335862.1 Down syndrome cell adhesion molecule-like protein Dscam2 [Eurytemora affinis]